MNVTTNYLANVLGENSEALLALRELPSFHQCTPQLLELLFRYGKVISLHEGDELTREGEFDQWVYFIIKGRLAVYVGEERVDTISSSLVGERCILGEQRRATLRASEEGVTALGVDMALLDVLRDRSAAVSKPISAYLELLSIIAGEVVNRVAELEFNLLDFRYKYIAHSRTDRLSEILRDVAQGVYRADHEANFAIYRHLLRHDPVALSHCVGPDGYTVDTRQLYADAVLAGDHNLLYRVAEAVQNAREPLPGGAQDGNGGAETYDYATFSGHVAQVIMRQSTARNWDEMATQAMASGIRKRMRLDETQKVDLRSLMHWLVAEYRFTAEDTVDLLMTLLKESSDATARINTQIKTMVRELTQTRFAKELGQAALRMGDSVANYYRDTPLEELIPFFSVNILDVYLVQPYLERLPSAHSVSRNEPSAEPTGADDGLIDTLFK